MGETIHVLLMGSGQIGSRHLQSLVTLELPVRIFVVDPHPGSLLGAKERMLQHHEMAPVTQVEFHASPAEIKGKTIDIALIATTAACRYQAFSAVVERFDVHNIIFEKFLFQKKEEYFEIEKILEDRKIAAWVNCPRRCYPIYQRLKNELSSTIHLLYQGSNWGLACNTIHFLDLVNFFTDETIVSVDCSELQKETYHSKREGFVEFYGTLSARFSNGSMAKLSCVRNNNVGHMIHVSSGSLAWDIDEINGQIYCHHKGSAEHILIPLQSTLTRKVVAEILNEHVSILPTYETSKKLHLALHEALLGHMHSYSTKKVPFLPIT